MSQLITTSHLTNGKSGGASSFGTASISPGSNKLLICTVFAQVGSGVCNLPTVTGCGVTWTNFIDNPNSNNTDQRIMSYRAKGAPTTGALTIDFSETTTSVFWTVDEFNFVDTTGTNGANAILQTNSQDRNSADPMTMAFSLPSFGDSKNATYCAMIGPDTISGPSGFDTIFTDNQDLGPDNNVKAAWKAGNDTAPTFTSTGGGANEACGLAFEIKYALNQSGFIFNLI